MRKTTTSSLQELEVINICGGEKLGYPSDFHIDIDSAKIDAITVSAEVAIPIITKKTRYLIPWHCIQCIGEDAILVRIDKNDLASFVIKSEKGKKSK